MPEKKKVLAYSRINARAARGGENPPIIVTIPKEIVDAFKLKLGETLDIITDGEKIVLKRIEIPKI